VPVAATMKVAVCPTLTVWLAGCAEIEGATATAFTVSVAVPDFVVSCVDVAVRVAFPEVAGAVNSPDELTVPIVANHVTEELKLPVPWTVAEHWLVWPVKTVVGLQEALTEVMVGTAGFAVSVAALLVIVPAVLLTVTVNCDPLSVTVVAGVV